MGRMDARRFHVLCAAYYMGSANKNSKDFWAWFTLANFLQSFVVELYYWYVNTFILSAYIVFDMYRRNSWS